MEDAQHEVLVLVEGTVTLHLLRHVVLKVLPVLQTSELFHFSFYYE